MSAASQPVDSRDRHLSRNRILSAALELVDREGFESLTMRRLAEELSSSPMSLYRHVRDRDDLLDGLTELLSSEAEPPVADDWHEYARLSAQSVYRVALKHPNAFPPLILRPLSEDVTSTFGIVSGLFDRLADAGLSPERAMFASRALANYMVGAVLSELVGRVELPGPRLEPMAEFEAGLEILLRGIQQVAAVR